jgi:hypothetical protein
VVPGILLIFEPSNKQTMTDRDLFARQHAIIEDMKQRLDDARLYNLSLDALEAISDSLQYEIDKALERKDG